MDKRSKAQFKWSLAVAAALLFSILLSLYGEAEASFTDVLDTPIELHEVGLTYRRYFYGQRDPLLMEDSISNTEPSQEFLLRANMDVFRYFYLDNNIHGLMDRFVNSDGSRLEGQFRAVGWEFRYGVRPLPWLEFGYYHHSQHLLDTQGTVSFPSESGYELHVLIYQNPKARESIF